MGLPFVVFYLVVFSGYIVGLLLLGLAVYTGFVRKSKLPTTTMTTLVFGLVGCVFIGLNYQFIRSTNPDYQRQQKTDSYIQKNIKLAKQISFPTYVSSLDGEQRASIISAHPPLYVLSSAGDDAIKMYQYQPGTRPYTLTKLPGGSCDLSSVCKPIGKSALGQVYTVEARSVRAEAMFFVSDGQTSLFIEYDKTPPVAGVLEFVNGLRQVAPAELPFKLL